MRRPDVRELRRRARSADGHVVEALEAADERLRLLSLARAADDLRWIESHARRMGEAVVEAMATEPVRS